jgi:hypothetical protein
MPRKELPGKKNVALHNVAGERAGGAVERVQNRCHHAAMSLRPSSLVTQISAISPACLGVWQKTGVNWPVRPSVALSIKASLVAPARP